MFYAAWCHSTLQTKSDMSLAGDEGLVTVRKPTVTRTHATGQVRCGPTEAADFQVVRDSAAVLTLTSHKS